jgi:hypothetical protein
MNIESKLWKLISYNDAYVHLIQKASGVIHTVSRGRVPNADTLAMMSERAFDNVCRDTFHDH